MTSTSMNENLSKLEASMISLKTNLSQMLNGKKIASTRSRSDLLALSKVSAIMRKEILEYAKAIPARVKKTKEADKENVATPAVESTPDELGVAKVVAKAKKPRAPRKPKAVATPAVETTNV